MSILIQPSIEQLRKEVCSLKFRFERLYEYLQYYASRENYFFTSSGVTPCGVCCRPYELNSDKRWVNEENDELEVCTNCRYMCCNMTCFTDACFVKDKCMGRAPWYEMEIDLEGRDPGSSDALQLQRWIEEAKAKYPEPAEPYEVKRVCLQCTGDNPFTPEGEVATLSQLINQIK